MSTHTPGPWKWFDYPDGRKLLAAPSRAVVHCPDAAIACDPADAHLIAAAPDLLAACRAFIAADPAEGYSAAEYSALKLMHAAIAKAEGKGQAA